MARLFLIDNNSIFAKADKGVIDDEMLTKILENRSVIKEVFIEGSVANLSSVEKLSKKLSVKINILE